MSAQFTATTTANGLLLGKYAEIVLVAEDQNAGLFLWIQTKNWRLEIRVTPSGLLRVGMPTSRYQP